jgi:hypothetical protein
MSDNVRAVPPARVSALAGIRAAISEFVKSSRRVAASSAAAREPADEVTISPEAKGKLPNAAELIQALRTMEMSRYRAAASAQVARAADEQLALVISRTKG